MLDFIELNDDNSYIQNTELYVKSFFNVYKYKIVECKNEKIENKAFIYIFKDEFKEYYLAFPNKQIRDLFSSLLKAKAVGLKTAMTILKEFEYEEIINMVKELNYEQLTKIKGFGLVTSKNILETLQQELFDITYTPREEKIIKSVTRLGYPRDIVLKTIKKVDSKLKDDEFIKVLLSELGKGNQQYA